MRPQAKHVVGAVPRRLRLSVEGAAVECRIVVALQPVPLFSEDEYVVPPQMVARVQASPRRLEHLLPHTEAIRGAAVLAAEITENGVGVVDGEDIGLEP